MADSPGQHDLARGEIDFIDAQMMLLGELLDGAQILRCGAVAGYIVRSAQLLAWLPCIRAADRAQFVRRRIAQIDADLKSLVGINRFDPARVGRHSALATGKS